MPVGLTAIAKKWPWYSAHDTDLGAHVAQSERHRRACAVRRLAFWAAGEACLMGGVTFEISISVDATQARRHGARR